MIDSTRCLQILLDRQDILDCINTYCRGVDRFDKDLILSAYHPDAIDFHGEFQDTAEKFVEWAFGFHSEHQTQHQHLVLNHTAELEGDTAHTETYWIFVGSNKQGDPLTMSGGRYVDRFERRQGRWAIASRVCVHEWRSKLNELPMHPSIALYAGGSRDKSDVSYRRPLQAGEEISNRAR